MRIVVVDSDAVRARETAATLESEGLLALLPSGPEAVRASGEGADVLLVAPSASAVMLAAAVALGVPIALLLEESPVPSCLVRAVPVGFVPLGGQAPVRALLEGALAARRGRAETLRHAEALASAGVAILLVGREGWVEWANEQFSRIVGGSIHPPGGLLLVDLVLPRGSDEVQVAFFAAVAGRCAWSGEALLRAGGVHVPCLATVAPAQRAHAEPEGVVVTLVDFREQRAAEDLLREANGRLERLAYTDCLTGAFSLAYLREALPRELGRARRHGRTVAVLWIEIEHFKRIVDEFGCGFGDEVLLLVVAVLKAGLSEGAFLARCEGNDFCAVLPGTDLARAVEVAERLRQQVAELRVAPPDMTDARRVWVRIGVATSAGQPGGREDAMTLLGRAERVIHVSCRTNNGVYVAREAGDSLPPPWAPEGNDVG